MDLMQRRKWLWVVAGAPLVAAVSAATGAVLGPAVGTPAPQALPGLPGVPRPPLPPRGPRAPRGPRRLVPRPRRVPRRFRP